jgi:hypothetical protein
LLHPAHRVTLLVEQMVDAADQNQVIGAIIASLVEALAWDDRAERR